MDVVHAREWVLVSEAWGVRDARCVCSFVCCCFPRPLASCRLPSGRECTRPSWSCPPPPPPPPQRIRCATLSPWAHDNSPPSTSCFVAPPLPVALSPHIVPNSGALVDPPRTHSPLRLTRVRFLVAIAYRLDGLRVVAASELTRFFLVIHRDCISLCWNKPSLVDRFVRLSLCRAPHLHLAHLQVPGRPSSSCLHTYVPSRAPYIHLTSPCRSYRSSSSRCIV